MFKNKISNLLLIPSFLLAYIMFIFIMESFSIESFSMSNEDCVDKKVYYMGFQKMESQDTITSINDPSVFNNVDSNLINIFDSIQLEFGKPIRVKWGYRDVKTNKIVGGARNSAHMYGKALDLCLDSPSRESIKKLITISSKYNILGLGVYSDAQVLHIDIDSTKGRRVWGSSYSSRSVPRWAYSEVKDHLSKPSKIDSSFKLNVVYVEKKIDRKVVVDSLKKSDVKSKVKNDIIKVDTKVEYYTVKKGDTVYSLAKNNGTTVEDLCRINNINEYKIKIGQKIRIK